VTTEFKRLGRRGSYRLGRLKAQGVGASLPPTPFRPSFARSARRGSAVSWLLALITGVLAIIGGAALGWWFVPFAAGLAAGLANRIGGWPARIAVPAVFLMGLAGWAIPLAWQMSEGQAYRSVARVTTALLGLSASATVGLGLTVLLAAVQACAGYWLGRALTPRPIAG
jgi:hypothetical protein